MAVRLPMARAAPPPESADRWKPLFTSGRAFKFRYWETAGERKKKTSLNSTCLTPKPLASSVYVHLPEAPSACKLAISVMSLFHSFFSLFLDGQSIVVMERGGRGSADHFPTEAESDVGQVPLVDSSGLTRSSGDTILISWRSSEDTILISGGFGMVSPVSPLASPATPAPARRNRSCPVLGVFWDLAHPIRDQGCYN